MVTVVAESLAVWLFGLKTSHIPQVSQTVNIDAWHSVLGKIVFFFFFLSLFEQNRELQIMRRLEHQNIVKLKYFFYSSGEKVRLLLALSVSIFLHRFKFRSHLIIVTLTKSSFFNDIKMIIIDKENAKDDYNWQK